MLSEPTRQENVPRPARRHIGQVTRIDTFAEKFVEQCEELIRKDPETFKPKIIAFFAATDGYGGHWRNSSRLNRLAEAEATIWREQKKGGYFNDSWGIAPDHPYAKFVMEDEHRLFDPVQKLEFLGHTRRFEVDPRLPATPEAKWLVKNEHIFEGLPKKNLAELETWLHDVQKILPPHLNGEHEGFKPLAILYITKYTAPSLRQTGHWI